MKLNSENAESLKKSAGEYAESAGLKLNPDEKIVDGIIMGLLKKKEKFGDIHCPCRVSTGDAEKDKDITCPCIFHRKEIESDGHCKCNLFVGS
jgi:ferredoxin-thioredoxin reductase catalytic chain